jgi:SET domain-containing protein
MSSPIVAEMKGFEYDRNGELDLFDFDADALKDAEMLTVDGSRVENLTRSLNHSCDPRLFEGPQNVD